MHELKRISNRGIPAALERARQYRLLNEPGEAESICRDILHAEPENAAAIRTLLLALTDQLTRDFRTMSAEARALVDRLATDYEREYYSGVVAERSGKALRTLGQPDALVLDAIREAMTRFERAIPLAEADNEEATLRWNACVRLIERYGLGGLDESDQRFEVESFDDEVPFR